MVSMLSHGAHVPYPTMGPSIPLPLHQAMVVRELVVEVEAWSCWLVGWLVGWLVSSSISSVGFPKGRAACCKELGGSDDGKKHSSKLQNP